MVLRVMPSESQESNKIPVAFCSNFLLSIPHSLLAAGYHFEVLVAKKLETLRCEDGDGR